MAIIINNFKSGEKITEEKLKNIDENTITIQSEIDTNIANTIALQNKIDDALNPLTINLSLDKSIMEMGSTVNSVTATWTCNKELNAQTFEGASIDSTLRSKTYNGIITNDKVFTLTCTSIGGTKVTKTASILFVNDILWGVSSNVVYDSVLINSLSNRVLSNTISRTITVNAGSGQYIYYCLPKRLCVTEPNFMVNGFLGGFSNVATVNFTNSSSFAEDYYVYKSYNSGLGSTTITIS